MASILRDSRLPMPNGAHSYTWGLLLVVLATLTSCATVSTSTPPADNAALIAAGRQIYEHGILPSGQLLEAQRAGGLKIKGEEARCALCHQRSGMGIIEGAIPIPAVSAPVLFSKREKPSGAIPRRAPGTDFNYPRSRPPYDDATLARALREGISPGDYAFNYMMPRYVLAEADLHALTAYLRVLSLQPSPGISPSMIHFATVLTPGTDPARRDAVLGVLQGCFDVNSPRPDARLSKITVGSVVRPWQLHVWELAGPPDTWKTQLDNHYANQPVFALVSGLGRSEWAPVEQFCETQQVPCLFPNVELPGSSSGGLFSFYFSKGVLLEAEAVAQYLRDQREKLSITRVLQIHRQDGAGPKAAARLRDALAGSGIAVEARTIGEDKSQALSKLLAEVSPYDAVMLWLPESDLTELAKQIEKPPVTAALLVSGILGGVENAALTKIWKQSALMVYPYDLPERWTSRMASSLRPWLAQHHLPKFDERLQGDTLAACNLLADGMAKLNYHYLRDYLVELTENYSSIGNAPAAQAYPRFSIGPGQRFSSKGVYITRYAAPEFERIEKVEDWLVP